MHVTIEHYAGMVYRLDAQRISVYDSTGIGLRLTDRLVANMAKDLIAVRKGVKYLDAKGRRFTVTLDGEDMIFDVMGGELIRVAGTALYPEVQEDLPLAA